MSTGSPFALRPILLCSLVAIVAGCGGGGGAALPQAPSATSAPVSGQSAKVQLSLTIPSAKAVSARKVRLPKYVSVSTQGVAIYAYATGTTKPTSPSAVVDVSSGSSACTLATDGSRSCVFAVPAPTGTDTIEVDLYDHVPVAGQPSGSLVGVGTVANQQITAGVTKYLSIVIDGVVASISIQPQLISVAADGKTHAIPLTVNLLDADQNYIVGSDPLQTPVTMSISGDTNHTLTLSSSQITSPAGNALNLSYNGGTLSSATVTAAAGAITSTATVSPVNYTPTTISATTTNPISLTVTDAAFSGGTYTAATSDPTCATVSPSLGYQGSSSAVVTFTVTPVNTGACTITIGGPIPLSIPVSVAMSNGSISIGAATHWLVIPRSEPLAVSETGFTGTFSASTSGGTCSISPSTAAAPSGAATFTVSAVAEGGCTVSVVGAKTHTYTYDIKSDTWSTFGGDASNDGRASANTGITQSTVGKLGLRWLIQLNHYIVTSPIVANGRVYVAADDDGSVFALDAKTGSIVWHVQPFGSSAKIAGTPEFDASKNLLFLGQHVPTGSAVPFAALNGDTGQTVWTATVPGDVRGEPLITNGNVYIGNAGGDPPACYQGGVYGFNESTGAQVMHFIVDPTPNDGGSNWSPISFDGTNLIFGTGNTCTQNITAANAVVAVAPSTGKLVWDAPITGVPTYCCYDLDVGGGEMLLNGRVYFTSKNGNFYVLNDLTGAVLYQAPTGGNSPLGTPSTDGTTVIVSGGFLNATVDPGGYYGGVLNGFDLNANRKWQIVMAHDPVPGIVPITNNVAFANIDANLEALNAETGTVLWTYSFPPYAATLAWLYGSPAVAESGVYVNTTYGTVAAFGIGDTLPATAARRYSIGKPLPSQRVRVNEHGQLVPY